MNADVVSGCKYTQDGIDIPLTTCLVGRTVFRRSEATPGPIVVFGERDYLIPVADLKIADVRIVPKKGDKITETMPDGIARTFQVLPEEGEPAFRFADQNQYLYRLHCKYRA
jgi:hypothetical protein